MTIKHLLIAAMACIAAPAIFAQSTTATVKVLAATNDGYVRKISDNGKWGVIEGAAAEEGSIAPGGGTIINLETLDKKVLSHTSGLMGVSDITNDGNIVVGEAAQKPAYFKVSTGQWTLLTMPAGAKAGRLEAVTPDGRYAAGYCVRNASTANQDFDDYFPVMYDLATGLSIDLPNMPVLDMQHENNHMNLVSDISADGRYLLGRVSQSYVAPPALFCYVYDRQTSAYTPIGFTENKITDWTPAVEGTHFCDFPFMSPDGNYVVGTAYMVKAQPGSEWPNEYKTVFRYHIPSGEYVCYDAGAYEQNIDGVSVFNDGVVTAASPSDNPYADALVRAGKYFVSLDQVLKQNYNFSLNSKTGWDNTGKLICVSGDGLTLVTLTSPQTSYVIKLPEPLSEAAKRVDLLAGYSISPAEGTVMSKLKTFKIKFDRNITALKAANRIKFTSADGSESYTALTANVPSDATTTLSIVFQTHQLRQGVEYTLTIPEGMVSVAGDNGVQSKELKFKYTGHADSPMQLKSAYPADGASVAYVDLNNNPISLTFDMELAYGASPMAAIYRKGETVPYCNLNLALGDKQLLLYPTARVNLFQGTDYEVVVNAGSVTDLTGGCANTEIRLGWHGAYVREVTADDIYLFNETCDSYENFMFYEGDHRTPASTPAGWGFTADNTPWYVVRSTENDDDMAFASHSMYSPAGKADDWVMTPQLFIPDENCYLSFDAQSYLYGKNDILNVYIYEHSNVYNTLTADLVKDIRTNGKLAFSKKLSPGLSQEGLEDDWTNYMVRLNDYAGKDIYIAFVNENDDQSAIFIDNVKVVHDMHFLVTLETPSRVVRRQSAKVFGNIAISSEVDTYGSVDMKLLNASGAEISRIKESGLSLKKGDVYSFSFDKELPLSEGVANKYTISITLDNANTIVNSEIRNLMFDPTKRVVVEEYSGRDCGNCPVGFLAMENLEKLYPGRVLPVIIRTYQGDPLGSTVTGYSAYLGMEAAGAPMGRVNRSPILAPFMSTATGYSFAGAPFNDWLWLDQTMTEIAEPAEAEVAFTSTYNAATSRATVNTTVRNAISASGTNLNLFAVVVENGVDAVYQANYYANVESDILGDWGKGGKYASAYVAPFTIDDVARTTWGQTYQGTGGLIPSDIQAGKEYRNTLEIDIPAAVDNPANCDVVVMLIDAVKGTVLNANRARMIDGSTPDDSGVESVVADDAEPEVNIVVADGNVAASGAVALKVYAVDGRLVATAARAGDLLVADLRGFSGVAVVVATDPAGRTAIKKIALK